METIRSKLSRRNIVIALGAGIAGLAALTTSIFRPSIGKQTRSLLASNPLTRSFLSLAQADYEEWSAQVGSTFTVGGGYAIKLAGVRPMISEGARPPEAWRKRAFGAIFEVTRGGEMASDLIYTVSHPQYGPLQIFLSAMDNPRRMIAVFN